MPTLRIGDLVSATGGELLRGDAGTVVASFGIDTRRLKPGGVFFALAGRNTDGHRHLAAAARAQAAAAVISREPGGEEPLPPALIRVADTVRALGHCGHFARTRLEAVQVIALTGSTGKTTTKELIAAGLSATRKVHKTAGNLNNHLGVPLTLLAMPDDTQVAVVELGMNAPGEIAALADMAQPQVALVTNVGPAHMEYFRDLDGVAAAKGELFARLSESATSVVNLDDTHVRVQSQRHAGPRVTFGRHPQADVRLEHVDDRFFPGAGLRFRHGDKSYSVELKLGGAHSALNALSALATIVAAGGEIEPALEGIRKVVAGDGRGRVHRLRDGLVLIDDSYNCSPAALQAVLATLKNTPCDGRKVVVFGDMLELGETGRAAHLEAGRQIAASGAALLFSVGRLSRAAGDSAHRAGVREIHHYDNSSGAAEDIGDYLKPGDLLLVKGSRGIALEKIVERLVARSGGDA